MPFHWRRDSENTATGFWWLDWLTAPYWFVADWYARRAFYRVMRIGNESLKETEQWVHENFKKQERL